MVVPELVIARIARKHGVRDEDIHHAFAHPVRAFDLDDGFTLLIGAGSSGALLEIGVVESDSTPVAVHAMAARTKFLR